MRTFTESLQITTNIRMLKESFILMSERGINPNDFVEWYTTDGVGALEETLKWGQVSYLTTASGSGTTVRIDRDKASGQPAIYVNCKTDLLSRYRALYPDAFDYDGNRGVVLGDAPDRAALQHVIALALTYHANKNSAG